jgi:hypothetical protein
VNGKAVKTKVSGRRTAIQINGVDAMRAELKKGMTCEIGYPGAGEEATKLDCKSK